MQKQNTNDSVTTDHISNNHHHQLNGVLLSPSSSHPNGLATAGQSRPNSRNGVLRQAHFPKNDGNDFPMNFGDNYIIFQFSYWLKNIGMTITQASFICFFRIFRIFANLEYPSSNFPNFRRSLFQFSKFSKIPLRIFQLYYCSTRITIDKLSLVCHQY